jgi:UDP-N-acetylmuramoylalanine--D-glutamate ligase
MIDLTGRKIALLGFGVEGESSASYLVSKNAKVVVFDPRDKTDSDSKTIDHLEQEGVEFIFGRYPENFSDFDLVLRSPGIKISSSIIQKALNEGKVVTSQTQLFFDLCPAPIIGVTGTKGKGTTSTLIYEMLKKQGFTAFLGGNIGTPPFTFLDSLTPDSKVVLEMSSFQLQDLHTSPHIAVMLMTVPEHMDYHENMEEYVEAKRNILRFQKPEDFTILNADYPPTRESDLFTDGKLYHASRVHEVEQGCFVKDNAIFLKMNGRMEKVIDAKDIQLPGGHNLENACAAILAAIFAGATMKAIVPVLKEFAGLPHRLELVQTVMGVKYYDDSFSTTPETTIAAIEAFEEPKILILGGSSKKADFAELGKIISESDSVKAIIGIGVEWEQIKPHITNSNIKIIEGCQNMEEIVRKASEVGELGDIVLLSPACASFGMFKNYKERGDQFKEEVANLVQ